LLLLVLPLPSLEPPQAASAIDTSMADSPGMARRSLREPP
jgi:hypothetical protein